MTSEERSKHGYEIINKYVTVLTDPDRMAEIESLPTQDIITIRANASGALNEGTFEGINIDALKAGEEKAVSFYNAIKHIDKVIEDKLKHSTIWTITDNITRAPFIDDIDDVWVFTEKKYADECQDYFMQQYRTSFVVTEIPKEEAEKFFSTTAYMKGAKAFRIDMGAFCGMKIPKENIAVPPESDKNNPSGKPLTNPDFFRALAKFQEERFYRVNYKGKAEKMRSFEDNMIKAFDNARFLIPVSGLRGNVLSEDGVTLTIPSLKHGEGKDSFVSTPVFTDWDEFGKVFSREWDGWIWTPEKLLDAPDDTVCINGGSLSFLMSKQMIRQVLDIYEREFAGKKTGGQQAVANALNSLQKDSPAEKAKKVIRNLSDGEMYFVPFLYADEEAGMEYDDELHYTEEAIRAMSNKIPAEISYHIAKNKEMHFRFAKNKNTGEQFLPLFTSVKALREAFPGTEGRICLAGKGMVCEFAYECSGIIVDLENPIYNNFLMANGLELKNLDLY